MTDAFLQALVFFSTIAFVLFVIGAKIIHDDNQQSGAPKSNPLKKSKH